jgi:hypothetical protein
MPSSVPVNKTRGRAKTRVRKFKFKELFPCDEDETPPVGHLRPLDHGFAAELRSWFDECRVGRTMVPIACLGRQRQDFCCSAA